MIGRLREHFRQSMKEDFSPEKRKKVGGYVMGKAIGEGSFAKVHIGVHMLTKERVAIKVIPKKLVEKREYIRKNMHREATLLQRLDHPNIARLYEIMETGNSFYIVMELVEGGDMMKYLNDRNGISEREARRFMREIISAVDHMHRSGVIHRDLKVENLLMNKNRNIKIIDFGLSNSYDGENLLDTQCGSPAYAAPEIFNKAKYGPGVDVWSLGVNLYAMVTGQLPFTVDPPNHISKLYAAILKGCTIPVTLTTECGDLIRGMLEVNENKRLSIADIMKHPWLNYEYVALEPWPLREEIPLEQVDNKVMGYMRDMLSYQESEIIMALAASRPTALYATYQLLLQRLDDNLDLPIPPTDRWLGRAKSNNSQITARSDNSQLTARIDNNQSTARTNSSQLTFRTDNNQVVSGIDSRQLTARTDNNHVTSRTDKDQLTARIGKSQVMAITDNSQSQHTLHNKHLISEIGNNMQGTVLTVNNHPTNRTVNHQANINLDKNHKISPSVRSPQTKRKDIAFENDNQTAGSPNVSSDRLPNLNTNEQNHYSIYIEHSEYHSTTNKKHPNEGSQSMHYDLNSSRIEGNSRLSQLRIRKERTELILKQRSPDKLRSRTNNDFGHHQTPADNMPGCKSTRQRTPETLRLKIDPVFLTATDIRRLSDRFFNGHVIYDRFAPGASHLLKEKPPGKHDTNIPNASSTKQPPLEHWYHTQLDIKQHKKFSGLKHKSKLNPIKTKIQSVYNKLMYANHKDKHTERSNILRDSLSRKSLDSGDNINIGHRTVTETEDRHTEDRLTLRPSRQQESHMTDTATFEQLGVTYHLPYKRLLKRDRGTTMLHMKNRISNTMTTNHLLYSQNKSIMPHQKECRKQVRINTIPITEPEEAESTS